MNQYGLIGFPLTHSFSKKYFTDKFEKEFVNAKYELYEIPSITEFPDLLKIPNLSGLNVTIPYKEQVIPYLDELDKNAAKIGAVNVIKFIRNGDSLKLKGFNSDLIGFTKSIQPFLKDIHKKALILGTGGASKAIRFGLNEMGIETKFVSRNPMNNQLAYSNLNNDVLSEYLIIINTTPVGTFPKINECPAIPYEHLTSRHFLFDVVYNPAESLFLKKGREKGTQVMNGEKMLVEQAEAAWSIWKAP